MMPIGVKELFENSKLVSLGTADRDGNPNVVPIFWKKILDEDRIILLDNFMRATKENILQNKKVCLSFWDPDTEEAYKIKGDAIYHSKGPVYERGREFMLKKKNKSPRGVVEVIVTEIYTIKPGPDAGKRIA
ncbi:MAG: hypothetical protein DRO93_09950 [Candidatus Thorarchaeota archaeon]|nr:MAG: hypothetical protein DRO93_09950 [Candidatus Thorarchaeota archaeon]